MKFLLASLLIVVHSMHAQIQVKFDLFTGTNGVTLGKINNIVHDKYGFLWFSDQDHRCIIRFDGSNMIRYQNNPKNPNSLGGSYPECLATDSSGNIWIGFWGTGLDKFDPVANKFTHYSRNDNNNDPASLHNDYVSAVLVDHLGNVWVGNNSGLDLLDQKTGKFKHYSHNNNDPLSLSCDTVRALYEDKAGNLWIGAGFVFDDSNPNGGLNLFHRDSGTFTRYMHDPKDPHSLNGNKVRAIFEDSYGKFWVGTDGDGLHTMDRNTGKFTRYTYNPSNPNQLSRTSQNGKWDHITFITEDADKKIWIGTLLNGIIRYDPVLKQVTHYGSNDDKKGLLKDQTSWWANATPDGFVWLSTQNKNLFKVDIYKTIIPYYPVKDAGNAFYFDLATNILWIGTDRGLIQKNLDTKIEKRWLRDPHDSSLNNNIIGAMRADAEGKLWMATGNGLNKFDPLTKVFTSYWPNEKNKSSAANNMRNLLIDHNKNIWIAAATNGVYKMDPQTGQFINYSYNPADSNSLSNNSVICLAEDLDSKIWVGTRRGLNKLDDKTGKFQRYLKSFNVKSIFLDASGVVWVGTNDGLFRYNSKSNEFSTYNDPGSKTEIEDNILHIMEDDKKNLWVSTSNSIIKINRRRDSVKIYGESYGIHQDNFEFSDNLIAPNGELFIGDDSGYYAFFPDQLKDIPSSIRINFTSFKLKNEEVKPVAGSILDAPIWNAKEIKLNYLQNAFSFEFVALDYRTTQQTKYVFMLENYDNDWHSIGTDRKAYFFNVPPGKYIFRVRAVNKEGLWAEKEISVIITPPWWKTWWAYTIFGLLFISAIWAFIYYRSKALRNKNKVLEEKVAHRTQELQLSLENLKATQQQLIQSEKMASLGELTAGIAHEIQNPLNFVNNFSEVNGELIDELKNEMATGNMQLATEIANNIKDNEQKINHHGKRADAIVKGMLQHSRTSSGQKEPTDINALADEYLRLAYHGLRAKDKSFNAKFDTNFDPSIGKINVVPQDIGRVLLNLINNAFYAVNERKERLDGTYEPTVSVSTKKLDGKIEIKVRDNGNGISRKVLDKIFQPFFTTKPTGVGTGLGLSLSYDIIKAHGGEIKVETKEGEGSEFITQLPASN